jgi:hypothetical protein
VHAFEEGYMALLRMVLGACTTRQVVAALLSQMGEEEGEAEELPF